MRHPLILSISAHQAFRGLPNLLTRMNFTVQSCPDNPSWELLGEICPDVLICDPQQWLDLGSLATLPLNSRSNLPDLRLVLLTGCARDEDVFSGEEFIFLGEQPDIFKIHDTINATFSSLRRQTPRLEVNLPGMLQNGAHPRLGQIVNLSRGGLFFSGASDLSLGEGVIVNVPLLGMKTELEVPGQVVFQTHPERSNNFREGVGIEFKDLSSLQHRVLDDYLQSVLDCQDPTYFPKEGRS